MKFSRGLSILILLYIFPSSIFAVLCPNDVKLDDNANLVFTGSKPCDACAYFACMESWLEVKAGCPQDFYDKCSSFSSFDVDSVKKKCPKEMEYKTLAIKTDGFRAVLYVSGCGDETNGTKCLTDKVKRFASEMAEKDAARVPKDGIVYWKSGEDTYTGKSSDGPGPDGGKCSGGTTEKSTTPSGSGPTYDSNGALKFLGIIAIGWSLVAYIY